MIGITADELIEDGNLVVDSASEFSLSFLRLSHAAIIFSPLNVYAYFNMFPR